MTSSKSHPFIIGIAGGTASGKTFFCDLLKKQFPPTTISVMCLDWYYYPLDDKSLEERAKVNFDHPDSLELDLAAEQLRILKSGCPVECPQYDFAVHSRKAERIVLHPTPVIIVEGILTLHHEGIRNLLDYKIFMDAPEELCYRRRLDRDTRERGRTAESVKWQWDTSVQPMYQEFCKASSIYADKIMSGEAVCIDSFLEELKAKMN